jgi:predicted nucleic acid-binding protein
MRLTVAADTGAVLSLALSGLFDVCKKQFRIIIGKKIEEELKEISLMDDELGKAAKELLKELEIMPASHNFDKGEDEALYLLKETNADILVSDDIAFVKKQRNNEKISFSVVLFGILLEKKIITKEDFLKAVDKMFEKRKWDENLIYLVAKEIIEEVLLNGNTQKF